MTRDVWVKAGIFENGIGSLEARPRWESDPTEAGEIVRLDQRPSGELYFTFTDAEEFDGSYVSVQVTKEDLVNLQKQLTVVIHGGHYEHVPGFGDVIVGPKKS